MKRALWLAGVALALSTSANATTYNAFSNLSYTQISFTETPDSTPGYIDADTTISVTNRDSQAQTLYYIALGLSLNGTNAPWVSSLNEFSTGVYTAEPISTHILATYADVNIPEPTAAGYMPGGTIPLYTIGLVNSGQTVTFDVVRKSNATAFSTNVGFATAVPAATVPEPSSLALLGFGVVGIAAARRRRAG